MNVVHRVRVRCLTPKEGGRRAPILSGYRAPCFWGQDTGVMARLVFIDSGARRENPWGQREADMQLLLDDIVISTNHSFILREGRKIVAHGKVLGSRKV